VCVWTAGSVKEGRILWLKGASDLGGYDSSGSFAALRMTARTNNGKNKDELIEDNGDS
jgi:hypothetical protein